MLWIYGLPISRLITICLNRCQVNQNFYRIGWISCISGAIRWIVCDAITTHGPNHIRQCDDSWWRHQMETFSALLAICARNSPVPGEFPTQRPVTRSFDVFFDLRLNKRLNKQSWGWWLETLSRPLWRHCNEFQSVQLMYQLSHFIS